jgi:hypothetical protein
MTGLLDITVVGVAVVDGASLGLVVEAESEIGPTIPTLGLVVCTSGAPPGVINIIDEAGVASVVIEDADIESVGCEEASPLKPDDWTESAENEFVILAPRVATRPPSVERAEPVFV